MSDHRFTSFSVVVRNVEPSARACRSGRAGAVHVLEGVAVVVVLHPGVMVEVRQGRILHGASKLRS